MLYPSWLASSASRVRFWLVATFPIVFINEMRDEGRRNTGTVMEE